MSKKPKIKHNPPTVVAGGEKSTAPVQRGSFLQNIAAIVKERSNRLCWAFFAVLWCLLVFYEPALLFRIEELSAFLFTEPFFNEFLAVPAGMLSYAGAFLVQFFYYPALGATIYTLLLIAVYALTKKVFDIPARYSLVALLPVVALVASNMQLGYWIFYLKLPGYFYVALLAVIVSLFAIWAFKKMPAVARLPFVAAWVFVAYPLMGVYASAAAVIMAVYGLALSVRGRGGYLLSLLVAALVILLVIFVPQFYYYCYVTISDEYIYWAGTPSYQWDNAVYAKVQHEESSRWFDTRFYWVPFLLLLFFYVMLPIAAALKKQLLKCKRLQLVTSVAVVLFSSLFLYSHWFTDNNFRVENKQNRAMWEEDWEAVALYAKEVKEPTRQIVLNRNIALLRLGRAGNEMFNYPDGSSSIMAPMAVHLTQTGGKMIYYQYGKFNFCYRWCVEDAVEYGWRFEYLKHAVRSMLLSGEYVLAERYINILKQTIFHRSWAEEMELYLDNPGAIVAKPEFVMPLYMTTYEDALAVDESFVEAFLTKDFMYVPQSPSTMYIEVALVNSLIRKDRKTFWVMLDLYLRNNISVDANGRPTTKLPLHYQEAYILFKQLEMQQPPELRSISVESLEKGFEPTFIAPQVKERFSRFAQKVAMHNGANSSFNRAIPENPADTSAVKTKTSNMYVGPHFSYEYGDTYYYYFYFVSKIKTN